MIETTLRFKTAVADWFDRSTPSLTKVLGVMLIFYATLSFYSEYHYNNGYVAWNIGLGVITTIIFATLILIDLNFHINRAIGFYALAIATNRILRYLTYLNPPSGVVFVFSLIMIGVSINLCITGISFLGSTSRGRTSMMATTAIMLILNAGWLLFIMKNGILDIPPLSLTDVLEYMPDTLALIVLYVMLMCMLSTETVRTSSKDEMNSRVMNMIRLTDACGSTAFITKKDADILSHAIDDRSTWTRYDDNGPVECEFKFKIVHDIDDYSYVTVQKWKDSDRIYFTMAGHDGGSILNAYRFYADQIILLDNGNTLALFNSDGMSMRISINTEAKG